MGPDRYGAGFGGLGNYHKDKRILLELNFFGKLTHRNLTALCSA
jgi:hypothetical protein